MTNAIAIILGRAGSKGLAGKNMMPIAGRPCAQWTIEAARSSARAEIVAVSTDCPRLTRMAMDSGAEVVERPAELASDTATVDAAARHALLAVESRHGGRPFGRIVVLYANVPVRPSDCIDRAIELLERTGADSVQSYQPVGKHHPWWTARVAEDGSVRAWEGDVLNHGTYRRQDLPPAFIPDGGVIVVRRAALMLEVPGVAAGPHAFFGADRRGILNPEGSVVDIDSEIDAVVAEAVLTRRGAEVGSA